MLFFSSSLTCSKGERKRRERGGGRERKEKMGQGYKEGREGNERKKKGREEKRGRETVGDRGEERERERDREKRMEGKPTNFAAGHEGPQQRPFPSPAFSGGVKCEGAARTLENSV